jgi:hypothetical protein
MAYNYDAPDGSADTGDVQDDILRTDPESMEKIPYKDLRERCIKSYSQVLRDDFAFDLNMLSKELRIKMMDDPVYKLKTKALRAGMFRDQFSTLRKIQYSGSSTVDGKDNTSNILSALKSGNEMMFHDLNNENEDKKLNITFVAESKEDFENDPKIELHIGKNVSGVLSDGTDGSEEDKFKEKAEQLMRGKKEDEDDN